MAFSLIISARIFH